MLKLSLIVLSAPSLSCLRSSPLFRSDCWPSLRMLSPRVKIGGRPDLPLPFQSLLPKLVCAALTYLWFQLHGVSCLRCYRGVASLARAERVRFLMSPCSASDLTPPSAASPCPFPPSASIWLGGRSVHHSHSVSSYRGLLFCQHCGMVSARRLRGLLHPCPGTRGRTAYGAFNLGAISAHKFPRGIKEWPDSSQHGTGVSFVV